MKHTIISFLILLLLSNCSPQSSDNEKKIVSDSTYTQVIEPLEALDNQQETKVDNSKIVPDKNSVNEVSIDSLISNDFPKDWVLLEDSIGDGSYFISFWEESSTNPGGLWLTVDLENKIWSMGNEFQADYNSITKIVYSDDGFTFFLLDSYEEKDSVNFTWLDQQKGISTWDKFVNNREIKFFVEKSKIEGIPLLNRGSMDF